MDRLKTAVRRAVRINEWAARDYAWVGQPENLVTLRKLGCDLTVARRGDYIIFSLPHHDAGGERTYIQTTVGPSLPLAQLESRFCPVTAILPHPSAMLLLIHYILLFVGAGLLAASFVGSRRLALVLSSLSAGVLLATAVLTFATPLTLKLGAFLAVVALLLLATFVRLALAYVQDSMEEFGRDLNAALRR
jgi:hypothetical protein